MLQNDHALSKVYSFHIRLLQQHEMDARPPLRICGNYSRMHELSINSRNQIEFRVFCQVPSSLTH